MTAPLAMRALRTFTFDGRTVVHHERFYAGVPEAIGMVARGYAKAIDVDDQARLVVEAGFPPRRRRRGMFAAADPWKPWPGR